MATKATARQPADGLLRSGMLSARGQPPSMPASSPWWGGSPVLAALVISLTAVVAYHNSFSVPFVFDDELSIPANATIRSLTTAWWPPQTDGGLTVAGRPLLNFTFGLNYAISGTNVWSYHGLNLLIHVLAGLTLFGIVRRTLRQPLLAARFGVVADQLALSIAVLWTLHPLQTESVTYIVQRAESLASLCYLVTLWAFIRSTEIGAARKWQAIAFAACLLGMLSKEIMVSAPLMVFFYDRLFVAGSWRESWRRGQGFYLSLAATWSVLLVLVLLNPGRGGSAGSGAGISSFDYALSQIPAIMHYLRLVGWPAPLILDYGSTLVTNSWLIALTALMLFPLVGVSLWGAWRGRAWAFCGLFFFALLAPTSSVVPVNQTMAEHRMYLALAAVIALIVPAIYVLIGRKSFAIFAGIAVALGALTILRNQDYVSNIRIYEDTVAKRPENARAMALLGDYYRRAGRFDDARAMLERSLAIEPGVAAVLSNLGNVWQQLGAPSRAVPYYEQALAQMPANASFMNNLGNALVMSGRTAEGVAQLQAALRLRPDFPDAQHNLANALASDGRLAEAAQQLEALLKTHPENGAARYDYSKVLQDLGRGNDAMRELETAVRLAPESADAHNHLGIALAKIGRMREALTEFQAALAIDPGHASARQNAALAARRLGGG